MTITQIPKEWKVIKNLPTPLYKQVAMNIRWSISTGLVPAGETLPPLRGLASALSLGVNTVRLAYKLLENEGLVVSRPKRGTEVIGPTGVQGTAAAPMRSANSDLEDMLYQAAYNAISARHSSEEIRVAFESALRKAQSMKTMHRVAFVECSASDARHLAAQLTEDLGCPVEPVLLEDLESWLGRQTENAGAHVAIATTFFHYADALKKVQGRNVPVFGVVVESDPATLEDVKSMSPDRKIGIVCRAEDSVQYLVNKAKMMVGDRQVRLAFPTDQPTLEEVLRWADVFFVTQPCQSIVEDALPGAKVYFFYDRISDQSTGMLRQYLAELSAKSLDESISAERG